MAQHNRNWIFSWFLPALAEKQCSFGDCWSESVNEGRHLSPYTSFSPAQGENIPWCTAFLCFLATLGRAANCSWSLRWEMLSCKPSGVQTGESWGSEQPVIVLCWNLHCSYRFLFIYFPLLAYAFIRLGGALNLNIWVWILFRSRQHFTLTCVTSF